LNKDDFKLNPNGESVTALIGGFYDMTDGIPISLELSEEISERADLISYFSSRLREAKNISLYKESVIVADRGLEGTSIFEFFEQNEIYYVFRIKNGRKLVRAPRAIIRMVLQLWGMPSLELLNIMNKVLILF
jgi:hypothetical protein